MLTLAVHGPAINHDFLDWDDNQTVQLNPDFSPLNKQPDWAHYWTAPYLELYMPLTYMLWGVTSRFSRMHSPDGTTWVLDPGVYHAVSVGCIAAASCWSSPSCAAHAHPLARLLRSRHLRPASTASGIGRLDQQHLDPPERRLLSLGDLALPAIYRIAEQSNGNQSAITPWVHYATATIAFALALLSKPSVVVVPLIIATLEIGLRRRGFATSRCHWSPGCCFASRSSS